MRTVIGITFGGKGVTVMSVLINAEDVKLSALQPEVLNQTNGAKKIAGKLSVLSANRFVECIAYVMAMALRNLLMM